MERTRESVGGCNACVLAMHHVSCPKSEDESVDKLSLRSKVSLRVIIAALVAFVAREESRGRRRHRVVYRATQSPGVSSSLLE